jgi:ClpP class serine protease
MNFLTNPANIEALAQYITASIQYADRQVVREWVNTIYYNKRIDTVEVKADGVSDSRSTKIDVQVKITNDKGLLKGVNINVSLKVDDTALFGQVSGGEFSAVSTFFSTAIQENMSEEQQQFQTKTSGAKKMEYIYRQAAEKLKSKLKLNPQGTKSILGSGIKQFATRDNAGVVDENGNTVEIIDLNRGEATIYDFKNVSQKLLDYNFDVKFNVGKSGLPTIVIEEAESNKTLIQLRSMVQNLKDSKGRPYLYYRNYVEKGAFLKELIGSSANENPVTSS